MMIFGEYKRHGKGDSYALNAAGHLSLMTCGAIVKTLGCQFRRHSSARSKRLTNFIAKIRRNSKNAASMHPNRCFAGRKASVRAFWALNWDNAREWVITNRALLPSRVLKR